MTASIPTLEQAEWSLIQTTWPKTAPTDAQSLPEPLSVAYETTQGHFPAVLTSPAAKRLLTSSPKAGYSISDLLDIPAALGSGSYEEELSLLCIGISFLHAFIQQNWTGPDLDVGPSSLLTITPTTQNSGPEEIDIDIDTSDATLNHLATTELAYGGEPAYHLSTNPIFLRLALRILTEHPFRHLKSAPWWALRAHTTHQYVLDEPAAVPEPVFGALGPVKAHLEAQKGVDLLGQLILEEGLLHHHFGNDRAAAGAFVRSARTMGLEYELTGALGRRTKFQQWDVSQLVLLAESRRREGEEEEEPTQGGEKEAQDEKTPESAPSMPTTLALNDDTLLEQTAFTSSSADPSNPTQTPTLTTNPHLAHLSPSAQPPLHPLDQCILLSLCLNVKNTSPAHGLTTTQMTPYISRVLSHPKNWMIHTMALLLRSRLEASRTRTAERAVLQLQALLDQMPTSDSTLQERLLYIHDVPVPSKWALEAELAGRLMGLGVIRSALEVYERLEMWEEVVRCWGLLERPEKGREIVRELIEGRKEEAERVIEKGKERRNVVGGGGARRDKAREAKLWCLLGDLEPEHAKEHYEKAWAVSRGTSGRAMRSLGGLHFAKGEYGEARRCLREAVKINPMLGRSWFVLGCAAVREEAWEEAREAFGRCVAIDEEDGESWNNLASVYLRMGAKENGDETTEEEAPSDPTSTPFQNKLLAFRALRQGVKFSYENWRMWGNYMIVAIDVGQLAEAAHALSRVVVLRASKSDGAGLDATKKDISQFIDYAVLTRLVDAVTRVPWDKEKAEEARVRAEDVNMGLGLYARVAGLFQNALLPNVANSAEVYRAWAKLLTWRGEYGEALRYYLEGYKVSKAGSVRRGEYEGIGKEEWREMVRDVEEVVDLIRNFKGRVKEGEEGGSKWAFQARSVVRGFMGRMKDGFEDEEEWGRLEELIRELKEES
ncbi:hypothetical protein M422DRAFT_148828 [Sphaerobolus stellatus SS14]|nr:hypothetical protein M422DRAFT_148828 [Sphaerobolus stellatus SS14]